MNLFDGISICLDRWAGAVPRLRALVFYLSRGIRFRRIGTHTKVLGSRKMRIGRHVALGDFCWIQAVTRYGGMQYCPDLFLGDDVAISDLTHISCVLKISIGNGCLLGSKIYIGDHSHGSTRGSALIAHLAPAVRPLGDVGEIRIGERVWIGDGVVILAGTQIASGSIIGANSVVALQTDRPALIAGVPARIISYLDDPRIPL